MATLQDFERLRQRCRASGKLFVDPQFPPSASSLYVDPSGKYRVTHLDGSNLPLTKVLEVLAVANYCPAAQTRWKN